MSDHDDRIPVPVNGHRPGKVKGPEGSPSVASSTASPAASPAPATAPALDDDELRDPPRIIVTPGQATIVGFGIIASLILVLVGRRRGRKG